MRQTMSERHTSGLEPGQMWLTRKTVDRRIEFRGHGLHGGQPALLQVLPAPAGHGIVFVRSDLPVGEGRIEARYDLVSDTRLCTRLTNEFGASVSTIEHLMAALAGAGVSDALIRIDGAEVPILDGSAQPFTQGLARVGLRALPMAVRGMRILEPVSVVDGDRVAELRPSPGGPAMSLDLEFEIDFDDAAIGRQKYAMSLSPDGFAAELADCRTFCKLAEVEGLRKIGLAQGGGLENAIVVDQGRVLNPEGLRRPDEFVRHKMLDAVGDLALAGSPILGRYVGKRAGHEMTNRLLHALFAAPDCWEWAEAIPTAALPTRRRMTVEGNRTALAV
ncbi:MAG: UDP-3-O-acyl-N-acetylglucosamine deacetylase [Pseudomonadota bacterium]